MTGYYDYENIKSNVERKGQSVENSVTMGLLQIRNFSKLKV